MKWAATIFHNETAQKYGIKEAILLHAIEERESYFNLYPSEENLVKVSSLLDEFTYLTYKEIVPLIERLLDLNLVQIVVINDKWCTLAMVKKSTYDPVLN
jgi:hypothetical protein